MPKNGCHGSTAADLQPWLEQSTCGQKDSGDEKAGWSVRHIMVFPKARKPSFSLIQLPKSDFLSIPIQ
jgi:hypothetical protein